jgi:hypothetical protein
VHKVGGVATVQCGYEEHVWEVVNEVAVEGAGAVCPVGFEGHVVDTGDGKVGAALVGCAYLKTGAVYYAVEGVVGAIGGDAGFVYGIDALAISVDKVNVWSIAVAPVSTPSIFLRRDQ